MTGRVVAVVVGFLIVVLVGTDAISTLVTMRRARRRWWPTEVFYRWTWRAWRRMARRIRDDGRRESFLSVYGPASLLGLLVVWVSLQLLGWTFVWLGLRDELSGDVHNFGDALYYAGVGFFTIGFGDIVPTRGVARPLTLVEAFTGLLTTALVIGYLPTLYSAYSRREESLPTLDTLFEERVTGIGLIASHFPAGDAAPLWEFCDGWERWCASVEVSHGSYPMLALFRSQRPTQSWIAGLSVLADMSVILAVVVDVPRRIDALRLYRRTVRVVDVVTTRVPAYDEGTRDDPLRQDQFRVVYDLLAARGTPMRPFEDAWTDVRTMRAAYLPRLHALADALVTSTEFRSADIPMPASITPSNRPSS
jgi:hypothetical protein